MKISIFDDEYAVCNWIDDIYESTDPGGYSDWLAEKNRRVHNNMLIKATRLFKYLRDTKRRFSAKSILLTTLLGNRVGILDHLFWDMSFSNLPTSFRTLISRLDDFLQDHPTMPIVQNPVLDDEDFNRHWDQKNYETFRGAINRYRLLVDEAYKEADRDESIRKWRKVFGNEFAKAEVLKRPPGRSKTFSSEVA